MAIEVGPAGSPRGDAPKALGQEGGPSVFAVRVRGASMADDGLRDGDRLIVERRAAADGQTAVVEVDGHVAVKRLFRGPDGTVRLHPASPAVLPLVVAPKQVRVLGVVMGVFRRHGFRAEPGRSSRNRHAPRDDPRARELRLGVIGECLRVAGERKAVHRAPARLPLRDELARSLRWLRDCYVGTTNPRLRRALLREAGELVRRFDVELR